MEEIVLSKRRKHLESELLADKYQYDLWFDYARLEEQADKISVEKIRDVYERAISNQPLIQEKLHWKRYIYLWINYAVFEEDVAQNIERTRQIYNKILSIIPHDTHFTFSKIWIFYAQFLLRRQDLAGARKLLGQALGRCPRKKVFRFYCDLEF